ncbi:hypothetical protein [Lysinibacillus fusiformis]|uniref:hypothetical protein n=1 Tax=Lysinibacillus fusiformis TaxID=28031 RepID=UPI00215B6AA4|nr:hypothetical protein [Lysinibacillus fusiformis]MCR8853608.1 hypothetical protein [Lysinibacillus fusiformis]WKT74920.1 hypothetical protein QYY55_12455 [Lysinibacillus fusiformis]
MELGALKKIIFNVFGWASVSTGLWTLIMVNSWIIVGYGAPFTSKNFITLTIVFGFIAILSRPSRSLGKWGLFIGGYLILFMIVLFFVGWSITPFP